MDYATSIQRVYDQIEQNHVDKAVMVCLRIARHLKDHFYTAVFLREVYPNKMEFSRVLYDDTSHLKEETQKFLWDKSLEYWRDAHTLSFGLGLQNEGGERNILAIGVGELDSECEQLERTIQDITIPPGMGQYDIAAFTDRYTTHKSQLRLLIRANRAVKEKIKARCLNYAILIERQLEAQQKTQSFLDQAQTEVNNYFKSHSEDVYIKLQKAAQLLDSGNPEDPSLLLTQVRRAIKASADFFYPPSDQPIRCSDGKERILGDEQYLNRMEEFLSTRLEKSTSRDLLRAEFEYLAVIVRRLNDLAAKGVHASVSSLEAKQGLIGLYMFLYSVCNQLVVASTPEEEVK